jgi:catechol 2,3-dioxygenase-like lactoylglutathione lyase family enzyme
MKIDRIHHVAYRCKDAKTTVDWYVKHLKHAAWMHDKEFKALD